MNENNNTAETVEIKTAEPKAKLTPAEKREARRLRPRVLQEAYGRAHRRREEVPCREEGPYCS